MAKEQPKEQLIISVGREFGSAGHVIAEEIARRLDLPFYDYQLLRKVADENDVDIRVMEKYDEIPRVPFLSRNGVGSSNSPSYNIAMMQFDYLRKMAYEGQSFVVVGRCSDVILKGYTGLIRIFILADMEDKIVRTCELFGMDRVSAEEAIISQNTKRKEYHNYYCESRWGDSRNYDISINRSALGIEGTTDFLMDFIEKRREILRRK
ncbi:MAG: cytidylate kinase-like family protein [Saccharofermentans sp.]|nr:cytidylate kinase-like family protein [Saccharofermentans sp.]